MKKVVESLAEFMKSSQQRKSGYWAGDGEWWIKCADFETARLTKEKYILYVGQSTGEVDSITIELIQ